MKEIIIKNKTLLGIEVYQKANLYISDEELNHHLFISGATGCGKTSTIKNFILSAIKRGIPLIYIDGKGDQKLPQEIKTLCKKHKRNFKYFEMSEQAQVKYNPLLTGGYTELKDKIISMFSQIDQPKVISVAENEYLQLLFKVLKQWKEQIPHAIIDLYTFAINIDINKLIELTKIVNDPVLINEAIDITQRLSGKLDCLISEVKGLLSSQIGHLFRCNHNDLIINLEKDISNKAIIYFGLSDLNYSVYTSQIGKLVINDLKVIFGNVHENTPLKTIVIFDELTTYAGNELNSLLARARSKGLHAIVSSQGFNVIKQTNAELANNLTTNCNTFIIHQQNNEIDAEMFSAIVGKHLSTVKHKNSPDKADIDNAHKVLPDDILSLKTGFAYVLRKNNGSEVDLVNINY